MTGVRLLQTTSRTASAAWAIVLALTFAILTAHVVSAQPATAIHSFSGGDGNYPAAGLVMDKAGNLYGTTLAGGSGACMNSLGQAGCGTVFKLAHKGSGWILTVLYSFGGGNDGAMPQSGILTLAPDGTLYGTTSAGGGGPCSVYGVGGCGTVFSLRPPPSRPASALTPWVEKILYSFKGGSDGAYPTGGPVLDQAGNLYGAAGSYPDYGDIYELTPSGGGSWTHSIAHAFSGPDGWSPIGNVIFDKNGNLYGTTLYSDDGSGGGVVFQLAPSGSGWTETVLHDFTSQFGSDGGRPQAGVIIDASGNLFGVTSNAGKYGGGTVFELSPSGNSWTFSIIDYIGAPFDCGPYNNLLMDQVGNMYGTTLCGGGYQQGEIFRLKPLQGGGWESGELYAFRGAPDDGGYPFSNVVMDANGNLYGTGSVGGAHGKGDVFELKPN